MTYDYRDMFAAVASNDLEFIRKNQALVNDASDVSKVTPLHIAMYRGTADETVGLLIELKANIEAGDDCGMSPLYLACSFNKATKADVLLTHRADVNTRSDGGMTPLISAATYGNLSILRLLLEYGALVGSVKTGGALNHGESAITICDNSECRDLLERARKYQESPNF
ncbi:MAG: ankyrin repeat domain-containing protein [Patescibacteria group bacterium]|nr:ankyrin repeat domain-containing protein [Patescibacteria group bacterium]